MVFPLLRPSRPRSTFLRPRQAFYHDYVRYATPGDKSSPAHVTGSHQAF